MVAAREKIGKNAVGRPCFLIRRADHRDGFDGRENIAKKASVPFFILLFGYDPAVISGAMNSIDANFIDPLWLSETMRNSLSGLTVSSALFGCVSCSRYGAGSAQAGPRYTESRLDIRK
jgi:hypothetical protein